MADLFDDPAIPILVELEEGNEAKLIRRVLGSLSENPQVSDLAALEEAVFERQRNSPPLLGQGVALPHARTAAVSEIVYAVGRSCGEVPFGPEARPVRLVFLFGVPPHQISEYLATTAALARRLSRSGMIESLLEAADGDAMRAILSTS